MIDEKQNPQQQSGQQPQQENKPASGQQQDRKPSQGSPQPDIPREPRNADTKEEQPDQSQNRKAS
jgi:hypothetical protein